MDLACRVAVQLLDCILERGLGTCDLLRGPVLVGEQARQFLLAPDIGLVDVDPGAKEETRQPFVAFTADGVHLGGVRGQFTETSREPGVAILGLLGGVLESCTQGLRKRFVPGGKLVEESAVLAVPCCLGNPELELPHRRARTLRRSQRCEVTVGSIADSRHA